MPQQSKSVPWLLVVLLAAGGLWWFVRDRNRSSDEISTDRRQTTSDGVSTPTDGPPAKRTPGSVVELSQTPESHYQANDTNDAPPFPAPPEAAELGARHDSALSQAAAEIAFQAALNHDISSEDLTTFILHSSGSPDSSAARYSLLTNDPSAAVLTRATAEALASPAAGNGSLFYGVGEADTPGATHTRRIVVLMVRRDFELAPTARTVALGSTWIAKGRFTIPLTDARATVLHSDGVLSEADLEVDGDKFELTVKARSPGTFNVGIDATSERGPGKLLQLSVFVGDSPPRKFSQAGNLRDPEFGTTNEAETYAFELLNADRDDHDVGDVIHDVELAAIAREHSEDMRNNSFFGHQSPRTGLAGDRIRRAKYRASAFAENLAKNNNIVEAQRSLLLSVGHRANLLNSTFTHVGVGLAKSSERGEDQWYLTQVFARKTVELDLAAVSQTVRAKLTSARSTANLETEFVSALDQVAEEGAERAASGETKEIAERIGRQARGENTNGVSISVQVVYSLDDFVVPAAAIDPRTQVLGVGISQSQSDHAGAIGIVVISGR